MSLTLYAHPFSSYSQKVLIALYENETPFEWRVLDWNEPSIKFYESLGATLMPTWILVRMTSGAIATLAVR